MTIEIRYDSGEHNINILDVDVALFLAANAVRDIADAIAHQASVEAPLGETGALKAHPVDIHELQRYSPSFSGRRGTPGLRSGEVVEPFPSFGGGLTVRGAGGRFVKGGITQYEPGTRGVSSVPGSSGHTIEEIEVTLPDHPHYAKFVHNGTGMYGKHEHPIIPVHSKFLKFTYHGIKYLLPSVYGQEANPYLERAFLYVNRTYVPAKAEELRIEIKTL